VYSGPPVKSLPNLPQWLKDSVQARLDQPPAPTTDGQVSGVAGKPYTNQDVIRAFATVYRVRGAHPEEYWRVLTAAGLAYLAEDRRKAYTGKEIRDLPNVPPDVRKAVEAELAKIA